MCIIDRIYPDVAPHRFYVENNMYKPALTN